MKQRIFKAAIFCSLAVVLFLGVNGCQNNDLVESYIVEPSDWSTGVKATDAWVLAYMGSAKTIYSDCLHLAYSGDGLTWTNLNSGSGIYYPTIGTGHIRDPFIFRKNDGSFVLLASNFTEAGQPTDAGSMYDIDYWGHPSSSIYVAESDDLVTWKNERLLRVTNEGGTGGDERHAWSPKAVYDADKKCYAIYWVGNNYNGINRTYVTYTPDFYNIKSTSLLFDPGYSHTGSFILNANSENYLFYVDDDVDFSSSTGGDIQLASSAGDSLAAFSRLSSHYINRVDDQDTRVMAEAPFVIKLTNENRWLLYATYTNDSGNYGCWATDDLDDPDGWEVEASFSMVSGRSASPIRVTADELDALDAAY